MKSLRDLFQLKRRRIRREMLMQSGGLTLAAIARDRRHCPVLRRSTSAVLRGLNCQTSATPFVPGTNARSSSMGDPVQTVERANSKPDRAPRGIDGIPIPILTDQVTLFGTRRPRPLCA